MARTGVDHDDESDDNDVTTFFDKVVGLSEGDTLALMGERLKVAYTQTNATGKTVHVRGRHEDDTRRPRYKLVADARYDDVDVRSTRRTDSHD